MLFIRAILSFEKSFFGFPWHHSMFIGVWLLSQITVQASNRYEWPIESTWSLSDTVNINDWLLSAKWIYLSILFKETIWLVKPKLNWFCIQTYLNLSLELYMAENICVIHASRGAHHEIMYQRKKRANSYH